MTGLFLTVSLLCLLPTISHTLDIPLQSALLIHGEPMGFPRSAHRQKRSVIVNGTVICKEDEYKARKANHCCNKCLAGFVVVEECKKEGLKTRCVPCEEGFFTKAPSASRKCFQCAECLSQFGQVTIKNCTTINDTVCGCPAGEYKYGSDRKFTCQECSICHNGTELHPCTAERNTVCKCWFNFYLDSTGSCRSCTECNDTDDCVHHCPPPLPARNPKEEPDVIRVLIPCVIVAAVLALGGAIIVINRKKISYVLRTKKPEDDSPASTQQNSPLIDSNSRAKLDRLPGHSVYVVEDSVQQQNTAQNSSLPLPDITQTTRPCLNRAEVLYKIIECIPVDRWKELMRRLGVSDHVIDTSEQDNRRYKDAQYAMLSCWVRNEGSSGTTMNLLFRVLKEMNLGGCAEKIEESL